VSRADAKICPRCGRRFEYRARWARSWQSVRYCSERCRRTRPTRTDRALEAAIEELLRARRSKTICPSEVARRVGGDDWRGLMERTRAAARRLAERGELEIRQRGERVDPSEARGAIRLARRRA